MSRIFAQFVAMIGAGLIFWRRRGTEEPAPATGAAPTIPQAKPQGIPTLKMPTAQGWPAGRRRSPRRG